MKTRTYYTPKTEDYEMLEYVQMTVPDMSFSVKEILRRFTRGTLDVESISRPVEYDSLTDDQIDNILPRPSDLTDYEDAVRSGVDILDRLRMESSPPVYSGQDQDVIGQEETEPQMKES
ncbi:hypothetical protein [Sigmofec virus UA08Rod_6706]|uniref:Uncharacterized protein n=1 Tax=Sigmofec virus UA08Rod_6706 TaxID=2929237 RepID=A0A976N0M0_9VIRU|nr:hypothetical protein [Sigmofec virus UA08Rod_6706]